MGAQTKQHKEDTSKSSEQEQLNLILIKSCTDFRNEIEQLKEEKENLRVENAKLIAENVALKNLQSIAGCTKTPLLQNSSPSTQNGGQNPSNIMSCLFGATGFGIFIFWDILFWIVFTCLTLYLLPWLMVVYMPLPEIPGYNCPAIVTYLTICWFSVLLETLSAILKHKRISTVLSMTAVCVLTAILLGLSVYMSLVLPTYGFVDIWQNIDYMYGFYLAIFASIWNFTRFAFQIKVIRSQNGGQILWTIVNNLFGTIRNHGNGSFILLDILFWIAFTCLTLYVFCIMPIPACSAYIPTIYITLCWFSVLFETLATIMKQKNCMIAVSVLTAILLGLSIYISLILSTHGFIDDIWLINMYGFYLAFFASIWNFARVAFQIKIIQWIRSSNGHPIHTSTQNRGQNISTNLSIGDDIYILLNILIWIAFTSVALYFLSQGPCDQGYNCPPILIYLTICWFSVHFETMGTILKHKICMIAVCVLTAILLSFSVYMSPLFSTYRWIWMTDDYVNAFYLAFFASIWNFARLVFQINLIRWIRSTNGHSIHTEETGYIPLLPQTVNGYQSI